jgi:hypothetical protein
MAIRSRRPAGADADGLVTCLICDRRFRSLGPHLYRAHQISAADYRAEHGLPAGAILMATATRQALSDARQQAMQEDADLVGRMRAATPSSEELARRSAEARAGTDGLAQVRAARRRGAQTTQPFTVQARRDLMDATARAAGYTSMRDAIEETRALPSREAATRIGVGASTVKRWRRKLK